MIELDQSLQTPALWRTALHQRLPLLGHRNWIVVADSAYPSHCKAGIQSICTGETHLAVIEETLSVLQQCPHIRPHIMLDEELDLIQEADAPGIDAHRRELNRLLGDYPLETHPHNGLIEQVDAAARLFEILLLKTTITLPYTSIFLQLKCGYWSDAQEAKLRNAIY
ncbi:hypothetical protein JXA32_17320 [Candidatus Sumerlaeota bacterium]|nr:hypothetical protein [Candidatus Sumerlaeota bacterium]